MSGPALPLRRCGRALSWLVAACAACAAWAAPAFEPRLSPVAAAAAPASPAPGLASEARAWQARVYSPADPGPVWFTADGPRPAATAALQALRSAGDRGLAPDDYDIGALERALEAVRSGSREPDAIAHADRALTAAILRFLADLRFGRVLPQEVEPHYRAPAWDATFVADLRGAAARDRIDGLIDAAEPDFPLYVRLQRLLADYRRLAAEPSVALPPLASPRSKVVAGDVYPGVPALHARLVRLGDLAADSAVPADNAYTDALASAVRRFQARHGLQVDGVLGSQTLAELNVPLAQRVTQIELSLERLRWLPRLPPGPLIGINIPSFQLRAWGDSADADHPALSMPVVVGRALRTQTPVFIGEMRYVEFSPYWNVPPRILRNELLPRLENDPSWAAREDMEVVGTGPDARAYAAVDGASIAALRSGAARLRQRPGPRNALGGVKFVLPNTMDIYLHATPARNLFERSRRDFSHGCIRVRDPETLAQFVLQGRPEWTPARIDAAMRSGVNQTAALPRPIPVIVFYTTALADSEGRVVFLADIYGQDRKLQEALRRRSRGTP